MKQMLELVYQGVFTVRSLGGKQHGGRKAHVPGILISLTKKCMQRRARPRCAVRQHPRRVRGQVT